MSNKPKNLVGEVCFKTQFCGFPKVIRTGAMPGWNLYVDTSVREIIVVPPQNASNAGRRLRVPFENIEYYVSGAIVPKELELDKPAWEG